MIIDTINCNLKCENGELEYVYNLTEKKLSLEVEGEEEEVVSYGVEAQSFIKTGEKRTLVSKEEIQVLTPYKHKAKEFISMLRRNEVSPIHLLDIAEEIIEEYYLDFDKVVQAANL